MPRKSTEQEGKGPVTEPWEEQQRVGRGSLKVDTDPALTDLVELEFYTHK